MNTFIDPTSGIDLIAFCANNAEPREHLRTPSMLHGLVIASNAEILIAVPYWGVECKPLHADVHPAMAKCVVDLGKQNNLPDWITIKQASHYKQLYCAHCDASGKRIQQDCKSCDGEGVFYYANNDYDCPPCSGNGKRIFRNLIESEGEGEEIDCPKCKGSGYHLGLFHIHGVYIQHKYFALLQTLPNCQVLANPSISEKQIEFKFDFGRGVVGLYKL